MHSLSKRSNLAGVRAGCYAGDADLVEARVRDERRADACRAQPFTGGRHRGLDVLERVYRVAGYSVYFRQGNEFADPRAVVTASFAAEGLARRVNVIVHEDLHDPRNFDLPWEIEESIVTPLGALVAVEFFRSIGDEKNLRAALERLEEERRISRELNALALEAQSLFKNERLNEAKRKILARLPSYSTYYRHFRRQTAGQHPGTVLEAKLSHDLAYFKYFDKIAALAETARDLKTLIQDLKGLPSSAGHEELDLYLQDLKTKYGVLVAEQPGCGQGVVKQQPFGISVSNDVWLR